MKKKIALIHYWLNNWRGGELVLKDVADLLADEYEIHIYTHVLDNNLKENFNENVIFHTTLIDKLPFSNRLYQAYILLMPLALKFLRLDEYSLIISFESGPAKGIRKKYNDRHISYVHSPMRYIWDMHEDYLKSSSFFEKIYLKIITPFMRIWDKKTSKYPQKILCNSNFVKDRIKNYWGRNATVVYPGIAHINARDTIDKDYFLFIGELNHYKKADLIFQSFKENGKELKIIGKGPFLERFKRENQQNIKLLGRVDNETKFNLLAKCTALIFPSKEDFGLVPIEAMMLGKPVIAFKEGGANETVKDNVSGLFFDQQSVKSLNSCLERFERNKHLFRKELIINRGQKFSNENFKSNFLSIAKKFIK